jgi:hypothetical protein
VPFPLPEVLQVGMEKELISSLSLYLYKASFIVLLSLLSLVFSLCSLLLLRATRLYSLLSVRRRRRLRKAIRVSMFLTQYLLVSRFRFYSFYFRLKTSIEVFKRIFFPEQ